MFTTGSQIISTPRVIDYDGGRHPRGCIGFILMSTDPAMEADVFRMVPKGVGIHFNRLKTDDHTDSQTLARHVDNMAAAAAILQPEARPDIICYGCTSGSIVCGEAAVMREIRKGAPWTQPMTLVTGVVDALTALGSKNLTVCTPYLDDINTLEAEFLLTKGFNVVDIQGLRIADGIAMGRVPPAYLRDFALSVDSPEADTIFISCSGIRSLDIIEELEQISGQPVITSNQAMLWACLRRLGVNDKIEGFGRLFQMDGPFEFSRP